MSVQTDLAHVQVKQEAISALLCILSSAPGLPVLSTDVAPSKDSPAAAISTLAAELREVLRAARYHTIKHVREAAVEALSVMDTVVPEQAVPRKVKPKLQPTPKQRSGAPSRKGPWLHQAAERPTSKKSPAQPSRPSRAELDSSGAAESTSRLNDRRDPDSGRCAIALDTLNVVVTKQFLSSHLSRTQSDTLLCCSLYSPGKRVSSADRDFGVQVFAPSKPPPPAPPPPPMYPTAASPNQRLVLLSPPRRTAPVIPVYMDCVPGAEPAGQEGTAPGEVEADAAIPAVRTAWAPGPEQRPLPDDGPAPTERNQPPGAASSSAGDAHNGPLTDGVWQESRTCFPAHRLSADDLQPAPSDGQQGTQQYDETRARSQVHSRPGTPPSAALEDLLYASSPSATEVSSHSVAASLIVPPGQTVTVHVCSPGHSHGMPSHAEHGFEDLPTDAAAGAMNTASPDLQTGSEKGRAVQPLQSAVVPPGRAPQPGSDTSRPVPPLQHNAPQPTEEGRPEQDLQSNAPAQHNSSALPPAQTDVAGSREVTLRHSDDDEEGAFASTWPARPQAQSALHKKDELHHVTASSLEQAENVLHKAMLLRRLADGASKEVAVALTHSGNSVDGLGSQGAAGSRCHCCVSVLSTKAGLVPHGPVTAQR